MIRINLLAPDRKAAKKKAAPSAPGALQAYLILGFFILGAAALCLVGYLWKSATISDLNKKITAAETKKKSLQAIEKQVQDFEKKKAELENKKGVLAKLKADQRAPVHMLDEISKALPDFVWLTALDETNGNVKIAGQAVSLSQVADFMTGLQRSGYFPTMELESSKQVDTTVAFNLSGRFQSPEAAARQKELEAKAAAPSAAPKK